MARAESKLPSGHFSFFSFPLGASRAESKLRSGLSMAPGLFVIAPMPQREHWQNTMPNPIKDQLILLGLLLIFF